MRLETVSLSAIKPDPENSRKHSKKNIDAIMGSLTKFGQRKPIVVWREFVIAGNGTLQAAQKLGWTQIEITRVPEDWSHEEARAYAIADNRTSELAEWDDFMLANQLIELDAVGWDISEFGFDPLTPPTEQPELAETGTVRRIFRLTESQADLVDLAIARAKTKAPSVDYENADANALVQICREWST
jgi:hypothetical protein